LRLINLRPGVDQQSLDWAISVIGVNVFVGLTAYDTQRIKEMYDVNDDGTISYYAENLRALPLITNEPELQCFYLIVELDRLLE
jgi:FtsH-binding integral membrane protein